MMPNGTNRKLQNNPSYECNKVITDILGKFELSVYLENTGKTHNL